MIDVLNESIVSMTDASKLLPTRPSISALWRWRQRGIRGVKLETVLIGGRRFTSVEALERFMAATSAEDAPTINRTLTARQREAQIKSAEDELDREGV